MPPATPEAAHLLCSAAFWGTMREPLASLELLQWSTEEAPPPHSFLRGPRCRSTSYSQQLVNKIDQLNDCGVYGVWFFFFNSLLDMVEM